MANLQGRDSWRSRHEGECIPVRLGRRGVQVPTGDPEAEAARDGVAGLSGKAVQLRMAAWFEKVNDDTEESGEVVHSPSMRQRPAVRLRH
jgi:hypothetical protein